MAKEDYTTYVAATNTSLAVSANDIVVTAMPRNEDARLSKDFGVNFFGDLPLGINFETIVDSIGADGTAFYPFGLSDTANSDVKAHVDGALDSIFVWHLVDGVGSRQIGLIHYPTSNNDIFAPFGFGTQYYPKFTRLDTTAVLKIYDDEVQTSLADTLTITTSATEFRYMYGFNTFKDAIVTTITGDVNNHELLDVAVVGNQGSYFVELQGMVW